MNCSMVVFCSDSYGRRLTGVLIPVRERDSETGDKWIGEVPPSASNEGLSRLGEYRFSCPRVRANHPKSKKEGLCEQE